MRLLFRLRRWREDREREGGGGGGVDRCGFGGLLRRVLLCGRGTLD